MSVHGYPADKSIFYCNLKLGLLILQEETAGMSRADIDQDDAFLAGVLQGAVGRAVCYCFSVCALLFGDNTRFSERRVAVSVGRGSCSSANRLLG